MHEFCLTRVLKHGLFVRGSPDTNRARDTIACSVDAKALIRHGTGRGLLSLYDRSCDFLLSCTQRAR